MNEPQIEVIPGPGVLSDFDEIKTRVERVASLVDWVQIDIADNKLVPNSSLLDPSPFGSIMNLPVKYEVHMMIENPIEASQAWVDIGFRRLLWHVESFENNQIDTGAIETFQKQDVEVGLAIDKDTPVDSLYPYLDSIDCVLVMTIKAGFSGQSFLPNLLDKVRALKQRKPSLPIEVDGGINFDTAKQSVEAGVTRLVSTSTLYNSDNIEHAIARMRQS